MAIKREVLSTVTTESSTAEHKGWNLNFSKSIENGEVKSASVNGAKDSAYVTASKYVGQSVTVTFNGSNYDATLAAELTSELDNMILEEGE